MNRAVVGIIFALLLPICSYGFSVVMAGTFRRGKAAASREEDLMLTLKIIMDHEARSTTVSKEQYISQMTEIIEKKKKQPTTTASPAAEMRDVSVPYDAAAKLAYEQSDKSMTYEDFKLRYESDAVADISSKNNKNSKKEDEGGVTKRGRISRAVGFVGRLFRRKPKKD